MLRFRITSHYDNFTLTPISSTRQSREDPCPQLAHRAAVLYPGLRSLTLFEVRQKLWNQLFWGHS